MRRLGVKARARKWSLAAAVALAHLAVLWLIAGSTRTPPAPLDRATEVGLVGSGEGVPVEALRAAGSPPRSVPQVVPPTLDMPAAASPAPDAPLTPPPAPPAPSESLPPVDLTARPLELDPDAAARLAARAAMVKRFGGDPLEAKCAVVERLQRALQADVAVQTALAMIPRDARSVANAVSVWNGTWANPDDVGGATTVQALQSLIADQLKRTPPACRLQILRGPRLITLQSEGGPTVLAVGSGEWRWADLVQ